MQRQKKTLSATNTRKETKKVNIHIIFTIRSGSWLVRIIRMIKSRRMRWAGHVKRMGEKRNAYRILERKPGEKRPLERPRHKLTYLRS
jgi:hypothetical protein